MGTPNGARNRRASGCWAARFWARRRRVWAALVEWSRTTIHLRMMQHVAQVLTEKVVAEAVARTQGALMKEVDMYRMAAPMGRVLETKDTRTMKGRRLYIVESLVGGVPSAAPPVHNVQTRRTAAVAGHERDPAATAKMVTCAVVPQWRRGDGNRFVARAQRNGMGDSRCDRSAPPKRGPADATTALGNVGGHRRSEGRACTLGCRGLTRPGRTKWVQSGLTRIGQN